MEWIDMVGRWLILSVGIVGCIIGFIWIVERSLSYILSFYITYETIGEYIVWRKEFKAWRDVQKHKHLLTPEQRAELKQIHRKAGENRGSKSTEE